MTLYCQTTDAGEVYRYGNLSIIHEHGDWLVVRHPQFDGREAVNHHLWTLDETTHKRWDGRVWRLGPNGWN